MGTQKLFVYTQQSEEGRDLPKDARCGASRVSSLAETSDGYLVVSRHTQDDGQQTEGTATGSQCWHPVPRSRTMDSTDVLRVVDSALAAEGDILGDRAAALGSSRVLALLDCDEAATGGHRHELLVGLRLQCSAAEICQRAVAAGSAAATVAFVRPPGALEQQASEGPTMIGFDDFINRESLTTSLKRNMQLLRGLRAA